jgi:hypothetical protein
MTEAEEALSTGKARANNSLHQSVIRRKLNPSKGTLFRAARLTPPLCAFSPSNERRVYYSPRSFYLVASRSLKIVLTVLPVKYGKCKKRALHLVVTRT